MKRNNIRLTESHLHDIIRKVLSEGNVGTVNINGYVDPRTKRAQTRSDWRDIDNTDRRLSTKYQSTYPDTFTRDEGWLDNVCGNNNTTDDRWVARKYAHDPEYFEQYKDSAFINKPVGYDDGESLFNSAKQFNGIGESRLRHIVSESVRRVLSEGWEDDYNAAMDKADYDRQKSEFDGYPWYKRLLKRVMRQNPKDPNPKKTADELAAQYVESFNQEHGMGNRTDYPSGESFHSGMRYQKGNYRPVMSATYFDGSCGYGERKAFDDNGNEEEWGIAYPYSEIGITGRPDDAAKKSQYDSDDVEYRYRRYDDARQEIGNVMKNRNNRKQGRK